MRGSHYSITQRILRAFFVDHPLHWFLRLYLYIDLLTVSSEFAFGMWAPQWAQTWTTDSMKGLLKDAAGYFITAQVGVLGVVSVAVGLVTLIAQGDESASSNTDVRLYYVEALAYELISSSAALLIILCAQVFWPAQFALHAVGYGGASLFFKVFLTALNFGWLAINLAGFAHFITTTLQFVEPSARARMRERYTANVIVLYDLTKRLLLTFYQMAAKDLVPVADEKDGPLLAMGHSLSDLGSIELQTTFPDRVILWDVKLGLLGPALRRWWKRSEGAPPANARRRQRSTFGRDVSLAIAPSFDREFQGEVVWCRRRGGVPFTKWELWLIRQSFQFQKAAPRAEKDLPTPATFLEELADKVIAQIERSAVTGFKTALDEMVRYHRFLLDLHDSQSEEGTPLSLAEVGGVWQSPHLEWIRQYRRVFDQAAQHLVSEPRFVEAMGYVPMRLLPKRAAGISPPVVRSILDLGILLVVFLEAWVTERAMPELPAGEAAQPRTGLPGSDRRVYEEALLKFVGAWENTLRIGDSLYDWRPVQDALAPDRWKVLTTSWPFFERHLRNTAYFLALAVWNEDPLGAERYRDMLLRWFATVKPGISEVYLFMKHKCLLTPDLYSLDWTSVRARLDPFVRDAPHLDLAPETLFFVVLRRAFDDALAVTAAVTLSWYMKGQQGTDIGGSTAALLMRRQLIDGDGTEPFAGAEAQITNFRWLFDMVIREAVSEQLNEGRYGSTLDTLVGDLDQMSERRMVSGRVYSSWGGRGLDSMAPPLIALLLAALPESGDAGVVAELDAIAAQDILLADRDASLRRIIFGIEQLGKALDQATADPALALGYGIFVAGGDLAGAITRLKAVFSESVAAMETRRTQRLRGLPLDAQKMEALRVMLLSAQISVDDELFLFKNLHIKQSQSQGSEIKEFSVGTVDKGDLSDPNMSASSPGLEELIASMFREYLAREIRWKFFRQPRKVIQIAADYPGDYWQQVETEHALMGVPAALLVPYDPIGVDITSWMYGQPEGKPDRVRIEHLNRGNGGGLGYIATINDLDVYTASDIEKHISLLVPTDAGASITYSKISGADTAVVIELRDGEDPRKSTLVVKYALDVNWNPSPHVQFVLPVPDKATGLGEDE